MTIKHFHEGELKLQDQTGWRARIDTMTQHLMRDYMSDQHREFFEGLEYIFLGTVDQSGLPHASIVTGQVGFATTPDPKTLVIQTGDRADARAYNALAIGQPVGVLGVDLSNRRRNRMHGRISDLDAHSITITVVQSYGNCPKYISLREISERAIQVPGDATTRRDGLSDADTAIIRAADTLEVVLDFRPICSRFKMDQGFI
ncbi:pyridoxamine 5'-phosphate oxidase family protein [uncultured Tateyamaria sp.]|uniref:pyridoxamine 5'-phosphate oxidase family protein n=1 Tax=uncultured Tateyamaria sp. TaxID=455651 RepID=UPI0026216600|nr:pyridoxamine 5'-phosphate oxidase family protein [uncultured Tateyamaria sp.]